MTRQQIEARALSAIDCALQCACDNLDSYALIADSRWLERARAAYEKAENVAYVFCDAGDELQSFSPWPSFEHWSGWYLAAARGESSW